MCILHVYLLLLVSMCETMRCKVLRVVESQFHLVLGNLLWRLLIEREEELGVGGRFLLEGGIEVDLQQLDVSELEAAKV